MELPEDVSSFANRVGLCEHFRQEPWPEGTSDEDRQRKEFIVKKIDEFCTGLEETHQGLQRKYIDRPAVLEELKTYTDWLE